MDAITEHHYHNIANNKAVRNDDGTLSTVRTTIVEIDGVETLIPTVWDGEIVDNKTAIRFAKNSGIEWPTRTGPNAVEELEEFDQLIHFEMNDQTSSEEAKLKLKTFYENSSDEDTGFALGGIATATKGITTQEGKDMAAKKFQLDDKQADLNDDDKLSAYEKARGEAIQKNVQDEVEAGDKRKSVKMYHGGTAMECGCGAMEECGCGGMMMDGMMGYDDVSGNPIPVGSNPENVRDDIDAKLSTDEYVLPAHVVKWHGLKHIQMLQSEAEMGLMSMQMDGLIQYADNEDQSSSEGVEDSEVSDESNTEQEEAEAEAEASDEIPSEEMDVEVATLLVDDQLDDTEDIEEIMPVSKSLPGMIKKQKFAFMV